MNVALRKPSGILQALLILSQNAALLPQALDAVRGHWFARAEMFEVIHCGCNRGELFRRRREAFTHGGAKNVGSGFCAKIDDELASLDWSVQLERQLRNKIVSHQVDACNFSRETAFRAQGHLHVRDFRLIRGETL